MMILVERKWVTDVAICGKLSVDNQAECYSLEPPASGPHPAIPTGTYEVQLLLSPRFQKLTPHVLDVPGRSEIEIHVGNRAEDTHGCILVGQIHGFNYIGFSDKAFERLMVLLSTAKESGETISITVQNAPQAQPQTPSQLA